MRQKDNDQKQETNTGDNYGYVLLMLLLAQMSCGHGPGIDAIIPGWQPHYGHNRQLDICFAHYD
jgi:hypothetical protein